MRAQLDAGNNVNAREVNRACVLFQQLGCALD